MRAYRRCSLDVCSLTIPQRPQPSRSSSQPSQGSLFPDPIKLTPKFPKPPGFRIQMSTIHETLLILDVSMGLGQAST